MLRANPTVKVLPISASASCYVIDDALLEPERWVERSQQHASAFVGLAGNAFPGLELHLPAEATEALSEFLSALELPALGAGAIRHGYTRLSLVTEAPRDLKPPQWLCHRDQQSDRTDECVIASLLYLFKTPELGGTSFYTPLADEATINALLRDSVVLKPAEFQARYGIAPGYLLESNLWFLRTLTVAPRFNRLIVYRGDSYHSAHISAPAFLSSDPARGRLTMNSFFVCAKA